MKTPTRISVLVQPLSRMGESSSCSTDSSPVWSSYYILLLFVQFVCADWLLSFKEFFCALITTLPWRWLQSGAQCWCFPSCCFWRGRPSVPTSKPGAEYFPVVLGPRKCNYQVSTMIELSHQSRALHCHSIMK